MSVVRIHRFQDKIALNFGGETVYISQDMAQQLSGVLVEAIADIASNEFTKSEFKTTILREELD